VGPALAVQWHSERDERDSWLAQLISPPLPLQGLLKQLYLASPPGEEGKGSQAEVFTTEPLYGVGCR
jgi:hypothetical protein